MRIELAISAAVLVLAGAACVADVDFELRRERARAEAASPLSLMTWNVEWFQDPVRGPSDDARQYEGARAVLSSADADLIALQEIASPEALAALVASLPDFALVVSDYEWPQQLALVYRPSRLSFVGASALHGLDDAGRPPLQVELVTERGEPLLAVVVHAKAGADPASHARRARFSAGLVQRLDERPQGTPAIVLGDFNDRLTGSILEDAPSPYAPLLRGAGYAAPTAALETTREGSTAWGEILDHIVLSHELSAVPGSADVLRDEVLATQPEFFAQVSDHAPVVLRAAVRAAR